MKPLIKVMLCLAMFFVFTFAVAKYLDLLSIAQIETWLSQAQASSPIYVGGLVTCLLFADLFVAVPTMTVSLFSGYYLGFPLGTLATVLGIMLAGITGFHLSRRFGEKILDSIIRSEHQQQEAKALFERQGFLMILMSRAVPILPEVTACLAGMTAMSSRKFLLAWSLNSIPYALITNYAGSVSSLENPKPALFAAIGISGTLFFAWHMFIHKTRKGAERNNRIHR